MAKKNKKTTPAQKPKKSPAAKAKPKAVVKSKSKAKPISKPKPASKAKAKAPASKAKSNPSPKAKAVTKSKPKPKASPQKSPAKVIKKSPVKSSPQKATKSTTKAKPATKQAPEPKVKSKPAANAPIEKPAKVEIAKATPAKAVSSLKPKLNARDSLRSSILAKKGIKASKPVAFSLDEVREIAKTVQVENDTAETHAAQAKAAAVKAKLAEAAAKPATPNHVKTASLADILGFNPTVKAANPHTDVDEVPEKFRRYYKLLLELRAHLTGQLDTHTEETLKRSSKDDSGDLSGYGQHMADAGTDTFDRDFALSLVSSEQEALSEVEAAIKRIKTGTYGICEVTGKPIARDRLLAVPFTRNSAEAQKEIEKTRYRVRAQSGLFGELGEEGATLSSGSDDGDD